MHRGRTGYAFRGGWQTLPGHIGSTPRRAYEPAFISRSQVLQDRADPALTAASSGSTSSEGSTGSSGEGRRHAFGSGRGSNPDEKPVTGALEATLKAAALKAVPGGTVIRIETDSGDAAYEAHMKKSDGSLVTVKFDTSSTVTGVEDGMGEGPGGSTHGGRHGGGDGQRSSGGSGESSPSAGA
jgi:uncharacterized membrane protein YkoI